MNQRRFEVGGNDGTRRARTHIFGGDRRSNLRLVFLQTPIFATGGRCRVGEKVVFERSPCGCILDFTQFALLTIQQDLENRPPIDILYPNSETPETDEAEVE